MIQLTLEQVSGMRSWFVPERRHLIGLHALNTGNGLFFVDRWPEPRAVLVTIGSLCSLSGDPQALPAAELPEFASGMMHCPPEFLPILQMVFPNVHGKDRVILESDESPVRSVPPEVTLRRLGVADRGKLEEMDPDLHWIGSTWGGIAGLASSGRAWAAFIEGRLASLAATFLAADSLEDIGVVTEPAYRGRGLAPLCAAALCNEIHERGCRASWTTSYDNTASIRVAEKLGFKVVGPDILYVLGKAAQA